MEKFREDVVWRTGAQIPDVDLVYEGHDGVSSGHSPRKTRLRLVARPV
jgi:hypothetical protein